MSRKFRKNKKIVLAVLACLLLGMVRIPDAMAYFTTYVKARGGYPITLGSEIEIEEKVENMKKHIVLENTGNSDCYVRTKVFCGTQYTVQFSAEDGWKDGGDGYWYFASILAPGEKTSELLAAIEVPAESTASFNIVVVQENTAVLYKEDGTPYADWNRIAEYRTDNGTWTGKETD